MPGQVIVDLAGISLTDDERWLLNQPAVTGVILFARNVVDRQQVLTLLESIRAVRQDLLITVDQEGGRVQRLVNGYTKLPAACRLGEHYQHNPVEACQLAEDLGWLMASEVIASGIDLSFAPVLDLGLPISQVIGSRAFAEQPKTVAELACNYCVGMKQAGMATVGKHYPGHGSVAADTHHDIACDDRPFTEIEQADLLPFTALIKQQLLDGIMPAHVLYPQVAEEPAGFSRYWLQTVLRESLNFKGIIFSDDLTMHAASQAGDYPSRALAALEAGCQLLLVCNNVAGAKAVVAELNNHLTTDVNIEPLKGNAKLNWQKLEEHPRRLAIHEKLKTL
ncbi:beta-N-acetylhexosaminidase [Spartinivicinus ruber]|uniref:beta-N-acetylhexosaminidase n=1 Tax=Spartinivicinus ruber TaxID=2683272 RepID=UPI0013D81DDB|nr:beta-N-acetylhexosaminidase [Spartinivicinus ruber]